MTTLTIKMLSVMEQRSVHFMVCFNTNIVHHDVTLEINCDITNVITVTL